MLLATSHRLRAGGFFAGVYHSAVLVLIPLSMAACGSQAQPNAIASAQPAAPLVRSELLILPPGQKMQEELEFWTLESQRLVLAYFDIYLRHGFEAQTSSRVIVADEGFDADLLDFAYERMEDDGAEWWAYVPQAGRVEHEGRRPDYVLIFDGLRFNIRSGGGSRQSYDRPGSGRVEVDVEYVLWDNRSQEVAAAGRLHEEAAISSPNPSNGIFKTIFEKIAAEVVRSSPLG